MLEVFREVHRVLRDDGTLFVNMGDAYANDTKWGGQSGSINYTSAGGGYAGQRKKRETGLKPKDLMMMPARVAMALQADGFYLRSMIPWRKRNAMPESVTDRPASAIEYIFMFSKSESCFWDRQAVMMKSSDKTNPRVSQSEIERITEDRRNGKANGEAAVRGKVTAQGEGVKSNTSFNAACSLPVPQRNRRNSDWFFESLQPDYQGLVVDEDGDPLALVVNPKGTSIAHFASYPAKLVEPFIKASTSERGCCADCGAPWERIVGPRVETNGRGSGNLERKFRGDFGGNADRQAHQGFAFPYKAAVQETLGWQPGCECHGKLTRGLVTIAPRLRKEDAVAWGADANGEYLGTSTKDHVSHGIQDSSAVKARIIRNATETRQVEAWVYESDMPLAEHPVKPCTVLDPFGGTSTTAMVATAMGRNSIVSELNPEYADAARQRDSQTALALL